MTFSAYIVFAIVLFLAIQYNKLIDRERMYKQYYTYALLKMDDIGIDPVQIYQLMGVKFDLHNDEKLAKEAITEALYHHFRLLGVKIYDLKIYWNE